MQVVAFVSIWIAVMAVFHRKQIFLKV
jgi:hypothetical protein